MLFQPTLYLLPLRPRHRLMFHAVSLYPLFPLLLPDSLRVLQWNAGGLRAISTEWLHFLSFHSVDLICIQKSNLNSPSCFRIPKFSALRSDRTHSGSGIFLLMSHTLAAASSFSSGRAYPSLNSLSSLHPYSDCVGVNISLNNSFLLSFLNVCAPPIRSSPTESRIDSFLSSILPSSRNLFILVDFSCRHPLWDAKGTSDPISRKYSIR